MARIKLACGIHAASILIFPCAAMDGATDYFKKLTVRKTEVHAHLSDFFSYHITLLFCCAQQLSNVYLQHLFSIYSITTSTRLSILNCEI